MSSLRVAYAQREDATPEAELSALVSVYKFVLDSHTKKKAGVNGTGENDAKGPDNDSRHTEYTERTARSLTG